MTRPGQKQNGYAGHRPQSDADVRAGNNARGQDDLALMRKPRRPKAS